MALYLQTGTMSWYCIFRAQCHGIVYSEHNVMALCIQSTMLWHCIFRGQCHGIVYSEDNVMALYIQSTMSWHLCIQYSMP